MIKESAFKPYLCWRYIHDIFLLWEAGKNEGELFIGNINEVHLTINFIAM